MRASYIEIADGEVLKWNINIVFESTCWSRTHAHCDGTRRVCKWKRVDSYRSLFTLLHEIGHIEANTPGMKRCEEESTATLWAIKRMREIGLPIKRKVTAKYKDYIRMTYERGIRRGLRKRVKTALYM